jgi:hypothetical protein
LKRIYKKPTAQHCIKAIAGEVVNSRSVHTINFCGGGQVIALKSATALIRYRYQQATNETQINIKKIEINETRKNT